MNPNELPPDWYAVSSEEMFKTFQTSPEGLSNEEAERRLKENGFNRLEEKGKKSLFAIFISQFNDLMIRVLIGTAIVTAYVSYMEGEMPIDTVIIESSCC